MFFRTLALGAIVFCGIMTTLLIRAVYFPEFERLPKVDPEHVMELFLDNRERAEIFIYKEAEVVGDVTITPRRVADTGKVLLDMLARGVVELPQLPKQKLNWRGKLLLGEAPERKVERVEFSVRFTQPVVTVTMHIVPSKMDFYYTVAQGGQIVTDSRTDPDAIGVAQVQLLMAAWGIDPGATAKAIEEGTEETRGWQARQGVLEIAGHRSVAYFVLLEVPGAGSIKLSFSGAGELLEIDLPLGYEMLSAALRKPPNPLPYLE